jgi:hypothetical protein
MTEMTNAWKLTRRQQIRKLAINGVKKEVLYKRFGKSLVDNSLSKNMIY